MIRKDLVPLERRDSVFLVSGWKENVYEFQNSPDFITWSIAKSLEQKYFPLKTCARGWGLSLQAGWEREEKRFAGAALPTHPKLSLTIPMASLDWSLFNARMVTSFSPCHLPVREAMLCKQLSSKTVECSLFIFNNYSIHFNSLGQFAYTTNENNKLYLSKRKITPCLHIWPKCTVLTQWLKFWEHHRL